jgi:hypothetical protein
MMSPTNDPNVSDALGGLLGALLGGHPAVQDHMNQTGKSLDDILGSISGSEAPAGERSAPAMGDILGALLGGGAPSGGTSSQGAGGDMLGSVLGSVLGGGGAPSGGMPSQGAGGDVLGSLLGGMLGGGGTPSGGQGAGGDALGSLLGGLLGGGMSAQGGMSMPSQQMPSAGADQISSILGGLLGTNVGGGAGAIANNPIANAFVAPIAEALAKKTGMAPGIAQVVVVFGLTTLMSAATQKAAQKGFSPNDLVNKLATDGSVSQTYLKDSGLVAQLAQQSGLDQATAAKSLQQAFTALGTHMGDAPIEEKQAALQKVLKSKKK